MQNVLKLLFVLSSIFGNFAFAATCHEEEVLDPSGRYCFIFNNGENDFHSAEKACYQYGGFHLAVIPNMIDNNFLWNISKHSGVLDNFLWIGATDITSDGTWKWVDGGDLSFSNWAQVTNPNIGNCAAMRIYDGKWQPYPCEKQIPYFCYGRARDAPTDPPTTPRVTTPPLRNEQHLIKFVGDSESLGDPNTDMNARSFYSKQREFIKSVASNLFANPINGNNKCTLYASPSFYGWTAIDEQFSYGAAWSQGQFNNLLEGNQWDTSTDHEYTIVDAITGLRRFTWSPPMQNLGYTTLVFFTARQNFTGIPSLFEPWPKFDEVVVVSMNGSDMPTPLGVPKISVSNNFNDNDIQAVVSELSCH